MAKETPDGLGFGAAAIKLTRKFQLKLEQHDPRATAGAQVLLIIQLRVWD